jgi:hypothetical protein
VNVPTDAELEKIADSYRRSLALDALDAPDAEAKRHLLKVERTATAFREALESANIGALKALGIHHDDVSGGDAWLVDPALAPTFEIEPVAEWLITFAGTARAARESIPKYQTRYAQRWAAYNLRLLFLKRGLKFSATRDSHAVATLVKVARLAGDNHMTADAARQWIASAKKRKVGRLWIASAKKGKVG